MKTNTIVNFFNFLTLIMFFVTYKVFDMMYAIATLMALSALSVLVIYVKTKSVPTPHLISAVMVILFGSITLISQDSSFIKIKVTVLNAVFAIALLVGVIVKKNIFKYILGSSVILKEEAYRALSIRFAGLFFLIAALNEIIRTNYSDAVWVNFKVFGIISITIIFMIMQLSFIKNNVEQK